MWFTRIGGYPVFHQTRIFAGCLRVHAPILQGTKSRHSASSAPLSLEDLEVPEKLARAAQLMIHGTRSLDWSTVRKNMEKWHRKSHEKPWFLTSKYRSSNPKTSHPGILLHPDLLMHSGATNRHDVESVGTSMLFWHSPIITKSIVSCTSGSWIVSFHDTYGCWNIRLQSTTLVIQRSAQRSGERAPCWGQVHCLGLSTMRLDIEEINREISA
jgi:hypothetical protein